MEGDSFEVQYSIYLTESFEYVVYRDGVCVWTILTFFKSGKLNRVNWYSGVGVGTSYFGLMSGPSFMNSTNLRDTQTKPTIVST